MLTLKTYYLLSLISVYDFTVPQALIHFIAIAIKAFLNQQIHLDISAQPTEPD